MKINRCQKGYLTITKFAEAIGRSTFCVKNWEEKGILKPAFIDSFGEKKYRYYTMEQVEEVRSKSVPHLKRGRSNMKNTQITDLITGKEVDVKDCLRISEFAEAVGKTVTTLNNWDKQGKFKPRFIDAKNKARYYTQEQVQQAVELFGTSKKQGDKDYMAPNGYVVDRDTKETIDVSECLTSKEFGDLCGISVPALYKREKVGVLRPHAIDVRNNRRYYKKEQA